MQKIKRRKVQNYALVVGAEYPQSRLFDALAPVKKITAKKNVAKNKAAKARSA